MTRHRHAYLAVLAALLVGVSAPAQEPIRFARTPDISPDGKLVTFSYLGDIWTVETIGGVARPVTLHQAHEINPVFSPDGRSIAFSSNRHGGYDVFVVPVHGGRPTRLTYDSAAEFVCGWSPDGKSILFTSNRDAAFPGGPQLYTVPVEGGRCRKITAAEGKDGVYSPTGDQIAYVRGHGEWYRKGYRGASNDDIWFCNPDGTNNRRLTTFNGQDASPMWSPDARFLYYVSEFHGSPANVVRQDVAGQSKPQLMTFHKDEAVRKARINQTGEWIVYECGPDLWVASTREGYSPRKLAIEVHADDKVNPDRTLTATQGATEFALSADEKHIAFVLHGEIFMMPLGSGGGKPRQLTEHRAYDHGIAWAPDSSKMIFLSDRNGHEDVYLLEADDPEHPKFLEAHRFKVTQITSTPEAEVGVSFAPDGKRVAFLRAGKLWTMNPDGSDAQVVVEEPQVFDYDWSPDSKWIVFARMDGSFASDLFIVPATGETKENPARNITRHRTYNGDVTWSAKGNKIAYVSERRRVPSVHVTSLQRPAAPNAPATSDIDWDDIHLRSEQAAAITAQSASIAPDGTRVAFRSSGSSGDDLWVAAVGGGQLQRLTTGNQRPVQIAWSKRLPGVIYFRDGVGALKMVRQGDSLTSLLGGASSAPTVVTIPFTARLTISRDDEFGEMLEQSWRALTEHFYDSKFHGIDWVAVRSRYRPLVKHCQMREDLYALISLMIGELNASHLGIGGRGVAPEEITADLGLLFDEAWRGPGLKIAEVVKRGPADRRGLDLKAGDVVLMLDGKELDEKTDLSRLLNNKAGETVTLQVSSNPSADPKDPKARRRVEIQPTSRSQIEKLMYDRWVEGNARRVSELSDGKLGYIHIPSMDEEGMDRFVRSLYSDNFDKEAIVLDVRYNGGGYTHDQVLNYLGSREHAVFRHRNGGEGLVLQPYDRKWTRPLVLLINGRSYSDAEIFPNAVRTLGLGKLVGEPTGGMVIGTSRISLIDGSVFLIPRIGVYTTKGVNMEKEAVQPDVLVEQHPDQVVQGVDPQLDKAVEVLREDVIAWKKKTQPGVAVRPMEEKPSPAVSPVRVPAGSK